MSVHQPKTAKPRTRARASTRSGPALGRDAAGAAGLAALARLQAQAAGSPTVGRLQALQRAADTRRAPAQRIEAEDDLLQGKAIQRQEEDEEPLQGKALQRQEEDEELLQGKALQRQEEDEEPLQGKALQRQAEDEEPLQGKALQRQEEDEELLQGKALQRAEAPAADRSDRLPRDLRAGMEHMSGMALDDVRVHRNSGAPAQVGALAYARGRDIHLGPGQEKHLPHEAWHVVQQAQGRVKPTLQAKGVAINDDPALEAEADVMGAKAAYAPLSQNANLVRLNDDRMSSEGPEFGSSGLFAGNFVAQCLKEGPSKNVDGFDSEIEKIQLFNSAVDDMIKHIKQSKLTKKAMYTAAGAQAALALAGTIIAFVSANPLVPGLAVSAAGVGVDMAEANSKRKMDKTEKFTRASNILDASYNPAAKVGNKKSESKLKNLANTHPVLAEGTKGTAIAGAITTLGEAGSHVGGFLGEAGSHVGGFVGRNINKVGAPGLPVGLSAKSFTTLGEAGSHVGGFVGRNINKVGASGLAVGLSAKSARDSFIAAKNIMAKARPPVEHLSVAIINQFEDLKAKMGGDEVSKKLLAQGYKAVIGRLGDLADEIVKLS